MLSAFPTTTPVTLAPASGLDTVFTLDDALLAHQRAASRRRLHTVQIPVMRVLGFCILCGMAVLQDRWRTGPFPDVALLVLIATNLSYAALAFVVLRVGYGRSGRLDLSLLFLHLDVLVWLVNLNYLEQTELFFAYFLLMRVADQVGDGFRRAIYFCHVVTFAYLGYAVWAHVTEAMPHPWHERLSIAFTMYLLGLYMALTGLVTERLRNRTRYAVRTARGLVASLGQKADALEAQAAELEHARRQAEQANLAKSQFLAVTSHEIRTPMNGILGAAELLMATSLTTSQQRYVQIVHRSGAALLGLIDDVLDLSRIEAGKLALNPVAMDLRALVDDAVDLVAMTVRDKPVTLAGRVDERLPPRVMADPLRLRQMLVNLLHNAVKFTDQGRVDLQVDVLDDAQHVLSLRFSVIDTGIGIAPDKLDSIFDAFTQADGSTTRRHGGSGLGLTIVKQLCDLMGGQVRVDSRVNGGSRFWIDLVLRKVPETVPAPPQRAALPDGALSVSVLLAEDDIVNQTVVGEMLRMIGCEVEVVGDGEAAWQAAVNGRYDIVFMDCHMPVMDGHEATRRIREDEAMTGRRRTVILALTADSVASDLQRCFDSGMDEVLTKPVSSAQLAAAIGRWTGRRTSPITRW